VENTEVHNRQTRRLTKNKPTSSSIFMMCH